MFHGNLKNSKIDPKRALLSLKTDRQSPPKQKQKKMRNHACGFANETLVQRAETHVSLTAVRCRVLVGFEEILHCLGNSLAVTGQLANWLVG